MSCPAGRLKLIIAIMNPNSKYFNMIRTGVVCAPGVEAVCAAPECCAPASYPAPARARGRIWFCLRHVQAYNASYNFFDGMSAGEIAAYQKSAVTGHRPTWRLGLCGGWRAWGRGDVFEDWQELLEARRVKRAAERGAQPGAAQSDAAQPGMAPPGVARARALAALGLDVDAALRDIKSRFKELVKRYHPDLNGGGAARNARLIEVLQAWQTLKAGAGGQAENRP